MLHPRRILAAVLLGLVGCTAAHAAPSPQVGSANKYLGVWNYDQPNNASMRNVAVMTCPASNPQCPTEPGGGRPSLQFPQIGNIAFYRNAHGGVTGHTDQGCTWNFAVHPRSLELTSAQTCFNHTVDASYTITKWSVSVSGRHEKETLIATSPQPTTGTWDFALRNGVRTKVDLRSRRDDTGRFVGRWAYEPANPRTLVNIVTNVGPNGQVSQSPQSGTVVVSKKNNDTIVARTANGCRWTLQVRGNTAELRPAIQTCGTETLRFWSIAGDGEHQDSIMNGSNGQTAFVLTVGSLGRTAGQ